MIDKTDNQIIGVLRKTSLVDFPGRVSSVIFLQGCTLRCPYCYNSDLVFNKIDNNDGISYSALIEHLQKRKNVISGLVLSGGEALLYKDLKQLIFEAKNLGYKIKLDTNGLLPEKIQELFESPQTNPDFIAMDIKTSPSRYKELNDNLSNINYEEKLLKTIDILSKLPLENYEFRTVLVPSLVTSTDIQNISTLLPEQASWQFANFRNENCLNPKFNLITPYLDKEIKELIQIAQKNHPNAKLR